MTLKEVYTTLDRIAADMEGKESKKVIISNDTYAICEFMEQLKSIMLMRR